MKMNILIVTSTRADFSLLKNLYKKLNASYTTKMLVTGTHLSKAYGYTIKEIKKSKINIYNTINWKSFSDNEINISRNFSKTLEQITAIFKKDKFDLLILLGDRYEILAAAISAHLSRVPIAHLHGGEVTGGVIDDAFRHSITKLSQIHFVANDTYKKRVIQLGEAPERVHNVGALGVENIKKKNFLKKNALEKKLGIFFLKRVIVINFHPETLKPNFAKLQIDILLSSLEKLKDTSLIFTMSGMDVESDVIKKSIKNFIKKNKNAHFYKSLGYELFFSLLSHIDFMIGNSSSGIFEMPYFNKITINLGDRQKGRVKAKSVVNVEITKSAITNSINNFYGGKYNSLLKNLKKPFGKGETTNKIVGIIKKTNFNDILIKKFNDR
ncbi:UDP-N-acetylglucosamine 2-epimerase [Candidatus Pelagibacter ubique]|nr:UDP-N-acetylglucosamine 2-epimerase [Candidatus Pelagibacter ubique]